MQRIKRQRETQRARALQKKEERKKEMTTTTTTTTGEATREAAEAEERTKRETCNARVAKKMQAEMKEGLRFCNLMTDVLRSVLEDLDPENPVLLLQPPPIGDDSSFAGLPSLDDAGASPPPVAADPRASLRADPCPPTSNAPPNPETKARKGSHHSSRRSKTNPPASPSAAKSNKGSGSGGSKTNPPASPSAARKALAAKRAGGRGADHAPARPAADAVVAGHPRGSTLRKARKRGVVAPSSSAAASLLKEMGDKADAGKKLSRKEAAHRLFEALRFRDLERGDHVAARMQSHDLWILARVAKRWRGYAGGKRGAASKHEKVFVQDSEEYDGDSSSATARAVSRQVLTRCVTRTRPSQNPFLPLRLVLSLARFALAKVLWRGDTGSTFVDSERFKGVRHVSGHDGLLPWQCGR